VWFVTHHPSALHIVEWSRGKPQEVGKRPDPWMLSSGFRGIAFIANGTAEHDSE
jgi:hypothetical protein